MRGFLFFAVALLASTQAAHAYIGPGAGLSAIGSVLAFLGVVLLLILGFAWYPIKRMLRGNQTETAVKADE